MSFWRRVDWWRRSGDIVGIRRSSVRQPVETEASKDNDGDVILLYLFCNLFKYYLTVPRFLYTQYLMMNVLSNIVLEVKTNSLFIVTTLGCTDRTLWKVFPNYNGNLRASISVQIIKEATVLINQAEVQYLRHKLQVSCACHHATPWIVFGSLSNECTGLVHCISSPLLQIKLTQILFSK